MLKSGWYKAMKASQLKKKATQLYNFTGLDVEQFEELCKAVKLRIVEQKDGVGEARQRAPGGD